MVACSLWDRRGPQHVTTTRGSGACDWSGLAAQLWTGEGLRCLLCQGLSRRQVWAVMGQNRGLEALSRGRQATDAKRSGSPPTRRWDRRSCSRESLSSGSHSPDRSGISPTGSLTPERAYGSHFTHQEPRKGRSDAEGTWPVETERGREPKAPSPGPARATCFGPGFVLAPGKWDGSEGPSPGPDGSARGLG